MPVARAVGKTVEWDVTSIAPGESVTVTIDTRFDEAGRTVNQATVTNPGGPWRPVVSPQACGDGDGLACAPVTVTAPLAQTGGGGALLPLALAGGLLALGILVVRPAATGPPLTGSSERRARGQEDNIPLPASWDPAPARRSRPRGNGRMRFAARVRGLRQRLNEHCLAERFQAGE